MSDAEVKPGICTACGNWLCDHVADALTAAERRGFIKGLEAARRIARKENAEFHRLGCNIQAMGCDWVTQAITARIKREKAKP